MDYGVFKTKIRKPEPAGPAPKPKPDPPPASPPKAPSTAPPQGPIPFMGGNYMEDFDRMSRIPGMRDFEVTYSKTYRWNLMDPMADYSYGHQYHAQPMATYSSGMQWLPPPHAAPARALPPRPPRRLLMGPPLDYGPPPGMILAPPPHHAYDYPRAPPSYGPYGGGGGGYGYYDDPQPEDCRVM